MTQPHPDERSIFLRALEIASPAERAKYLDEACRADHRLRDDVEGLLEGHAQSQPLLDAPDALPPTADQPTAEGPGTMIGLYKLIEVIGEGGMGVVYLAQQTEPVKRLVALKVIKAGMDSRQVLARFEAERQALALMDHPNIARVLDAGTTSTVRSQESGVRNQESAGPTPDSRLPTPDPGRPYFVMELVKGVPITKFCDERKLTPRQRLELFLPVCHAIQHAHQKGIIHRDIKPSNVLVALYDGKPVPKVIDFGVAKAAGQPLTEKTLVTGLGAVVGTPEYMSPEQAELNQLDIDTRSDVYSLGILLYELLTGTTPLTRKRMKDAALLEVLRVIREEEPQKPSTRLSTTDELPSIAANRGTEPARLSRLVRGELDWIVMKSLEKDRSRRYETANGFAMDVQRYLADEPLLAGPPSAGYRLRKFVRRNKGPVLAASLVVLTLLIGIVGTTVGLVRAEQARQDEAERAEGERRAKLAAEKAEQAARESEADTKAFTEFLVKDVLWVARPAGQRGGLGLHVTVRQALEAAQAKLDVTFRDRPRAEAVARHALGVTFRLIGEPQQAEPHLRRAASLRKQELGHDHEDTLQSQNSLGVLLIALGKPLEATPLLEETLRLRRAKLGPQHPHTLASMVNLATSYEAAMQLDRALPLYEEVLKLRTLTLGTEHPDTLSSMSSLASGYQAAGQVQRALPLYEKAFERLTATQGPAHPDTLQSMRQLARGYKGANRLDLALPLCEKCLQLHRDTLGPEHNETLASMGSLAGCYYVARKIDLALSLSEEALPIQTAKLGPGHPDTLMSMLIVASCYRATKKLDLALPLYQKVLQLQRENHGYNHQVTLLAINNLVQAYKEAGKLDLALPLAEEALKLQTAKLGPDHPDTLRAMKDLALAYMDLGKLDLALPLFQEVATGFEKRQFTDKDAASTVAHLVQTHERLKQFDQAEPWRRQLLALAKKRNGPESAWCNVELALLGSNLLAQRKFEEAESVLRECLALRDKIWPDGWLIFSTQSLLGAALLGQKKYAEAEPLLLQGYEGMKKREAQIPAEVRVVRLREALERLVKLYDAWGKKEQADEWRKELEVRKGNEKK